MKNTIERIQDSIDDIKTAINTKYSRNGEEEPIGDDTLLEDYALAIDNIKTEIVDMSNQILVFYCWAQNEADARSKHKPTITWDDANHKWSITCTLGEWSTSADEEVIDSVEKYLYAWFVSVNTNSDNTGLPEPDPVRLTGEKGEKGEDGSDGTDGVIEGLILRNIITLYRASDTEPVIQNISYEQGTDLSQLIPSNIKINNVAISSDPTSSANQQWSQTYEIIPEYPVKIWKIDILYSSKSEAMLLGNRPLLITNVVNVEIKYGTSISPEISPDTWFNEYPANTNNTVWIQRIEKLSDYTVKTIEYPIGLRGPAGIQLIANVESKNDLSSISPNYDDDYIGKLGVRVGQDVYVWYGTSDPYLTESEKIGSNYWLNVGPLSPIPDWNAKEGEAGYIRNRTHYENIITHTRESGDPDDSGDTRINTGDLIMDGIDRITIHYNNESEEVMLNKMTSSVTISGKNFDIQVHSNDEEIADVYDSYIGGGVSFSISWNTTELKQLDQKFIPNNIEELSLNDLRRKCLNGDIIPGRTYYIEDGGIYVTGVVPHDVSDDAWHLSGLHYKFKIDSTPKYWAYKLNESGEKVYLWIDSWLTASGNNGGTLIGDIEFELIEMTSIDESIIATVGEWFDIPIRNTYWHGNPTNCWVKPIMWDGHMVVPYGGNNNGTKKKFEIYPNIMNKLFS